MRLHLYLLLLEPNGHLPRRIRCESSLDEGSKSPHFSTWYLALVDPTIKSIIMYTLVLEQLQHFGYFAFA
jgi:hypothetical protein